MNIKKFIAFLLLCSMLLLACACKPEDADNADNAEVGSTTDTTDKETDKKTEADPQLKATDILLSDADSPVRIVYAEGFKSAANKIYDRLIALDKNFTIGKYAVVPDSAAESGLPEIVVGNTKHEASAEAKKLITESGCFYSVYASGNKIAVYLTDTDGIENAAAAVVKKIVKRGNAVVYDNAEGNFIGEFERTNLLKKLVKTAKNEGLPVYRISVYDENGLQTETINSSNPCQNCYSVAKVYCVTAIGMLFDEGKIKVTDTIGSIFAEELAEYGIDPTAWNKVTIHDVMRHRAGFEHGLLDIDAEDSTKWDSQDYLKLVLSEPLVYEPGEKRVYTDAAFYLISRVVTKISGEMLDEFLAARLFNLTECREFAFSTCPEGYPIGATGLYIRSADVAKLGYIYLNGGTYGDTRIISQEWVETVIKNGYELGSSGDGYAKGGMRGQYLYINFDKKVVVAWHSYDPDDLNGPLHDTLYAFFS
jgi:hypothetical protein